MSGEMIILPVNDVWSLLEMANRCLFSTPEEKETIKRTYCRLTDVGPHNQDGISTPVQEQSE